VTIESPSALMTFVASYHPDHHCSGLLNHQHHMNFSTDPMARRIQFQKRSYSGFPSDLYNTGLPAHGPLFQHPSQNHRFPCWIH
jgi:hypothetical protein